MKAVLLYPIHRLHRHSYAELSYLLMSSVSTFSNMLQSLNISPRGTNLPAFSKMTGSDDVRGSYYNNSQPPASSHYHIGPILPSHFPHVSPSFPHNQSAVGGPVRRVSTFADGRMLYNTNPPVSDPTTRTNYSGVPINSYSVQHHNHEGAPTPPSAWPHTTIDSVRDSVSPYTRPRPGEHGSGRNNCPTNNSTASNASSRAGPTSAANMPGGMQYNAQGRPLAYMLVNFLSYSLFMINLIVV